MGEKALHVHRKPPLPRLGSGTVEPRALIEHRDIDQPNAAVPGRPAERPEHDVPVAAPRPVPEQVVELDDRGVAGREHFRVGLSRDGREAAGIEPAGELVHALAPGPERIAAGGRAMFGPTRQRALEGVAVGIRQAGDDDPGLHVRWGGLRTAHRDRRDFPAANDDEDIFRPSASQQRAARQNPNHRSFPKPRTRYCQFAVNETPSGVHRARTAEGTPVFRPASRGSAKPAPMMGPACRMPP